MPRTFRDAFKALDLEEKILNTAAFLAILGLFCPWISGQWLNAERWHTAFGFHTSFLGLTIFLLELFILLLTLVPLCTGRSLIRKRRREPLRFHCACIASILTIASLSVIIQATATDFQRMNVGFGLYLSLVGSLVVSLYAYLRYQEYRRKQAAEFFQHPEDTVRRSGRDEALSPPPPPPAVPAAPPIEEHRKHR